MTNREFFTAIKSMEDISDELKEHAISELKKLDKSEFMDEFNDYKAKYVLPD